MSWVIIYGDFGEGLKGVVGDFDTQEEAEEYSEMHNLGHFTKIIMEKDEK